MYTDRLRELKYISPGGEEFTLQFDSLSRRGGKKAPVSEFPGQDQGAIQDLGETTLVFPITCYISGPDYDEEADRFWQALTEDGTGRLLHPRYGNHNVLPSSKTQTEEFVNGTRRAVFEIEFIKADDEQLEFPKIVTAADLGLGTFADTAAETITQSVPEEVTDPGLLTQLSDTVTGAVDTISGAVDKITGFTDDIIEAVDGAINEITRNIDTLIAAPQDLMESLLTLYRLPARAIVDVEAKINGYATIYEGLVDSFIETTEEYGEIFGLIAAGNLSAIGIAAAEATIMGNIPTRKQAGNIVYNLSDLQANINDSIEEIETAGSFNYDYNVALATENVISGALNNLIDRALSLPTEKVFILDRNITPIQLAYELYGDLDRLDFLIDYNNFTGDDLFLLYRGTEVRWYA